MRSGGLKRFANIRAGVFPQFVNVGVIQRICSVRIGSDIWNGPYRHSEPICAASELWSSVQSDKNVGELARSR